MSRSSNLADDAVVVYSQPDSARQQSRQTVYRIPRDAYQRRVGGLSEASVQRKPRRVSFCDDDSQVTVERADGRTTVYNYGPRRDEYKVERRSPQATSPDRYRSHRERPQATAKSRPAATTSPPRNPRKQRDQSPRDRQNIANPSRRATRGSQREDSDQDEGSFSTRKPKTTSRKSKKYNAMPQKTTEGADSDSEQDRVSSRPAQPPVYYPPPGPPPYYPSQPAYPAVMAYPPQPMMAQQRESGAKRFGKKLGNAAIFGVGFTAGADLVNSIF